ncbi:hypothetical protein FAZ15_15355 [Sphingobacterium olei]|uniref:Uncharacterized protein n=1 Tax=Sphingobacterium olei TaxID=2571155 RepID=A0A4U0NX56_9SPHI|nr:hypothetical protein [Sphingobacterium olei]TJZ54844.1 hypothetical protein FAZ15_15355 [Sphingobacterium olei]
MKIYPNVRIDMEIEASFMTDEVNGMEVTTNGVEIEVPFMSEISPRRRGDVLLSSPSGRF